MKYCVVDTIYGDVDSVHDKSKQAIRRMLEIYDSPDHEWDVAYWDEEEGRPDRLMSYTEEMIQEAEGE